MPWGSWSLGPERPVRRGARWGLVALALAVQCTAETPTMAPVEPPDVGPTDLVRELSDLALPDSGPEVGVPDALPELPKGPCSPNPCSQSPLDRTCAGTIAGPASEPGVCTVAPQKAPLCTYLPISGSESVDCAASTSVCSEGACVPTGAPESYVFSSDVTYLDHVTFAGADCCWDFTDDGVVDNQLGALFTAIAASLGESGTANDILMGALTRNQFGLMLERRQDGGSLILHAVRRVKGVEIDAPSPVPVLVTRPSFVAGTAQPMSVFVLGSTAPKLIATAERLSVDIPLGFKLLRNRMASGHLEGIPASGGLLEKGRLAAVVHLQEFAAMFNAYITTHCACVGLGDTPLMAGGAPGVPIVCADVDAGKLLTCGTRFIDGYCRDLAQYCPFIAAVAEPDVDTDGNGKPDAISLGLVFSGRPAVVTGVAAE